MLGGNRGFGCNYQNGIECSMSMVKASKSRASRIDIVLTIPFSYVSKVGFTVSENNILQISSIHPHFPYGNCRFGILVRHIFRHIQISKHAFFNIHFRWLKSHTFRHIPALEKIRLIHSRWLKAKPVAKHVFWGQVWNIKPLRAEWSLSTHCTHISMYLEHGNDP